jgi:ABC-type transport system substrate-binding protein
MRTTRALTAVLTILALAAAGANAVAQEKPRSGGILNWFDYGDPVRLDIHAESPLVVQQATAGIYSGLLHYDPDDPSKVAGDLAERWTASPDGRTYTFHLRKGVKWLNAERPPFNNPDLRRAVFLALDRQELVAKALEGGGVPCALLDPKLVGDFALPLEEVSKLPGCRQPKDQDIAEAKRPALTVYDNNTFIKVWLKE